MFPRLKPPMAAKLSATTVKVLLLEPLPVVLLAGGVLPRYAVNSSVFCAISFSAIMFSTRVLTGVGCTTMKWSLGNGLGAGGWIFGLCCAKGADLPTGNIFAASDHHFVAGLVIGAAGLATLLWVNLRNVA